LEIGEINQVIKSSSAEVEHVATLVLKHSTQHRDQLASFVSFSQIKYDSNTKVRLLEDNSIDTIISQVVQVCKEKLPGYMVPTYILPVSRLPLSVNNKVDNKALKALFSSVTAERLADRTQVVDKKRKDLSDTERTVQKVLADFLQLDIDNIDVNASFYQAGLDSISMTGFAKRLQENGIRNVNISSLLKRKPSNILQHQFWLISLDPTVASFAGIQDHQEKQSSTSLGASQLLAQKIQSFSTKHEQDVCKTLHLGHQDIQYILPCTPLQEGMLARYSSSDEKLYFNTFLYDVSSIYSESQVYEAWVKIINLYDILRTCFLQTEDGYAQICVKRSNIHWETYDMDVSESLIEVVRKSANIYLSSNRSLHTTPIHFLLLKREDRIILSASIFHALFDGHSWALILQDVERVLQDKSLPTRTSFSKALPVVLAVDMLSSERFWTNHLRLKQFYMFPSQSINAETASTTHKTLSLTAKYFEDGRKRFNCSTQAIYMAAWVNVLAKVSKSTFTFGVIVSGRSSETLDLTKCIGPLFNCIPCCLPLDSNTTWKELVTNAQAFIVESNTFQHTPLTKIKRWMQAKTEMFDTIFNVQIAAQDDRGDQLSLVERDTLSQADVRSAYSF